MDSAGNVASCMCHGKEFTEHRSSSYTDQDLQNLLDKCVKCGKGGVGVLYAKETEMRLNGKKMSMVDEVKVPSWYYPNA